MLIFEGRAELARIVMEEKRALVVGDPDLADGLGEGQEFLPQPEAFEDARAAIGDRRRTPVEIRTKLFFGALAVDHHGGQPRL